MFPNRFDIFSPRMFRNSPCSQIPGELVLPGVRAALGDLVLMMREDQVHAAGVDVEHVGAPTSADQLERHGRALEVPAGPAPAEGRVPGRARPPRPPALAAFQSAKSRASSLAYSSALTRSLAPALSSRRVQPGEPAVGGKLARWRSRPSRLHPRTPRPCSSRPSISRIIGRDVLGGPRMLVRRPDPQAVAVFLERPGERVDVLRGAARPSRRAAAMVRSSTSVRFMIWKTSYPLASSQRRSRSSNRKVRKFPMWA